MTRLGVLDPTGDKLARGEFICERCRSKPATCLVSSPVGGTVRVCDEDFGSALDQALLTNNAPGVNRGRDKRTVHGNNTPAL
jgi:hypothetical protein